MGIAGADAPDLLIHLRMKMLISLFQDMDGNESTWNVIHESCMIVM